MATHSSTLLFGVVIERGTLILLWVACSRLGTGLTTLEPEVRRLILPLNSMSRKCSLSGPTGRGGSGLGGGWLSVDGCDPVGPVDDAGPNGGGDGRW